MSGAVTEWVTSRAVMWRFGMGMSHMSAVGLVSRDAVLW